MSTKGLSRHPESCSFADKEIPLAQQWGRMRQASVEDGSSYRRIHMGQDENWIGEVYVPFIKDQRGAILKQIHDDGNGIYGVWGSSNN